jgi:hypothetical protein
MEYWKNGTMPTLEKWKSGKAVFHRSNIPSFQFPCLCSSVASCEERTSDQVE